MNRCCDGCGQSTLAGPPYLDKLYEMTNSHDTRDHVYLCERCMQEFHAWCARESHEMDLHEEE